MIRVLLVDDEAAQARAVRRAARVIRVAPGMRVDDCRSGRAASNRVRTRRYDVVIVDRGLGDMDGLELGRRLRTAGYAGALIMLTGRYKRTEDECAAFDAGFDDYVRKPITPAPFLKRIAVLARRTAPPPASERRRPSGVDPQWAALADEALEVSPDEPIAYLFSRPVALTPLEWRIVRAVREARSRGAVGDPGRGRVGRRSARRPGRFRAERAGEAPAVFR